MTTRKTLNSPSELYRALASPRRLFVCICVCWPSGGLKTSSGGLFVAYRCPLVASGGLQVSSGGFEEKIWEGIRIYAATISPRWGGLCALIGTHLSLHGGGLYYCRALQGIIDALLAVLRCFRGVPCLSVCFRLSERTRVFAQPLVTLTGTPVGTPPSKTCGFLSDICKKLCASSPLFMRPRKQNALI